MKVERNEIGVVSGDNGAAAPVHEFRLQGECGVSVVVWSYGASLVEMNVPDSDGTYTNLVVRLPRLEDYLDPVCNPCHLGATVGRFSRCVAQGLTTIDGTRHSLSRNIGEHHFHGGVRGFSRHVWQSESGEDQRGAWARFRYRSPAGEEGYPGTVSAAVEYRLNRAGHLTITHTARTDAPTIIGMSNHAYWNLTGEGIIDQHRLSIHANSVVQADEQFIPSGRLLPVELTSLDYRVPTTIGPRMLDACFLLAPGRWAVRLEESSDSPKNRVLVVQTDDQAISLHSGDNLPQPRAGLAIQPTELPDAPNQPYFPSVVLRPGKEYRRVARYTVSRPPRVH